MAQVAVRPWSGVAISFGRAMPRHKLGYAGDPHDKNVGLEFTDVDSETKILDNASPTALTVGMANHVLSEGLAMAHRFIPRNKAAGWLAYVAMVMMSTMFFTLIYVGTRVVLNVAQKKVLDTGVLSPSEELLLRSFYALVSWVVSALAFAFGTAAYLHFDSAFPKGLSWGSELGVWVMRIATQLGGYMVGMCVLNIVFDANLINSSLPRIAEHLSVGRALAWEFFGLLTVAAISGQLTHHTSEMVSDNTSKVSYIARDRHSNTEKFAYILPWAYAAGVILTYPLTHGCLGAIFAVGGRLGSAIITRHAGRAVFEPNMWIYVVANIMVIAFVILVRGTMLVPLKARHTTYDEVPSSSLTSSESA